MATIKDIARLSGYSIGTVSRVINGHADVSDKARAAVEAVIREQNYQPNSNAQQLKQQISTSIAVIVRGYSNIFFGKMLEDVQATLRDSGEEAALVFLDENANAVEYAVTLSRERKPKGYIFLGGNLEYFQQDFKKINVPCVLLTDTAEDLGMDNLSSFTTDDRAAAKEVILRMNDAGHEKIGIVGGTFSTALSPVGSRRMQGCMEGFQERNLSFDREKQYQPSRFTMEAGYEAAKKLLVNNPDLTAIFALGDTIAIGAMRAIHDLGLRVPEDIAVAGFDGIELADYTVPRLATVRQNTAVIAKRGVEDLLLRLNYSRPAVHEVIPHEFVDGESLITK